MSYIAATLFLIATGTQILLGAHLPIWMVWVACGLVASVFVTYGIFEFKRTFDRIYVSSQIIYSSILLIGTGTYFVFLGISGYFFRASHRDWSNHHLLILSTLGVFIIFLMTLFSTKIKTRIQSFWRRSIYQKKFDFREEWQHFSRMLANTLDISAMAENLISHTVRLFRIKHAALYLMGQDDGIFDFVAGSQNKSPMPQKLTLDESSKLEWDLDEAFRSNFSAALPLIVERKRLGVLFFRQPEKLRQEEFDLLSLFVDQAALAIYNLQLTSKLFEAKALQSVHKLSSFVIHDLRNHVSMLSMLLENSKKYAQRPDFRRDMMDTLESTVQDMKHLISKISISGDKSINTQAPLFINELVRKVIRELKVPKLDKVEIVEEYSIVPSVYGDETTFTALVRNLCLNAIEAMPAGGVVTVKTHCLDSSQNGALGDHKVNRDVEILVNDTGIGMSQEFIRDHVFHPFWSTKQNGLGIGLFQCKEIVESLGGRIRVDSRLGKGTTFTVSLPAMREASDERNEPIAKKLETELI
ncbi:MAG: ATP-binding protein [bacterium]